MILFYLFITCVGMAGAVNIRAIEGAVDITASEFDGNNASGDGGML